MAIYRPLLALMLLGCLALPLPAQDKGALKSTKDHVQLSHRLSSVTNAPGSRFTVTVALDIAQGWHLQAAKPTFDYLVPTTLTAAGEKGVQMGEVKYPEPKRIDFLGDPIDVFEGRTELSFDVTLSRDLPLGNRALTLSLRAQACDDKTCLAPSTMEITVLFVVAGEPVATPAALPSPAPSPRGTITFWGALLGAFIGGLLLNLMPCVLPVIAIKILGFVSQGGKDPAQTRRLGIIFGLGVLVSFWILAGLLIALQAGGKLVGWGFQFQDPRFLWVMTLVVTAIALNFFGVFEINLGAGAMNAAGKLSAHHGAVGAFWNGVLATALATPCTAPFLGSALGFAFSQPPLTIVAIFTAVGLGLALPYMILSWQPRLLKWIPKPGPWLEQFRQAMGFPMLAVTLWLLWVLNRAYGGDVLAIAAAWLLAGTFVIWLVGAWGKGRFRWVFLATVLVGLAGYGQIKGKLDEPRSSDSFRTQLQAALKTPNPVYVDFTADWCLTCQVNKRTSLHAAEVERRFKELGVVLITADWTRSDEEITEALKSFGRSGVPLNVLYPADRTRPPIILPEVLTPQIVLDALEKARS